MTTGIEDAIMQRLSALGIDPGAERERRLGSQEAAEIAGVSARYMRDLAESGAIPHDRETRKNRQIFRFPMEDVINLAYRREREGFPPGGAGTGQGRRRKLALVVSDVSETTEASLPPEAVAQRGGDVAPASPSDGARGVEAGQSRPAGTRITPPASVRQSPAAAYAGADAPVQRSQMFDEAMIINLLRRQQSTLEQLVEEMRAQAIAVTRTYDDSLSELRAELARKQREITQLRVNAVHDKQTIQNYHEGMSGLRDFLRAFNLQPFNGIGTLAPEATE
jgi:hypothetical protein